MSNEKSAAVVHLPVIEVRLNVSSGEVKLLVTFCICGVLRTPLLKESLFVVSFFDRFYLTMFVLRLGWVLLSLIFFNVNSKLPFIKGNENL